MVMVRKQVYLHAATDERLKAEARLRGVAEAVVIRERLEHDCSSTLTVDKEAARARFLQVLERARLEAKNYKGPKSDWKFNRDDAYEERLERQSPR